MTDRLPQWMSEFGHDVDDLLAEERRNLASIFGNDFIIHHQKDGSSNNVLMNKYLSIIRDANSDEAVISVMVTNMTSCVFQITCDIDEPSCRAFVRGPKVQIHSDESPTPILKRIMEEFRLQIDRNRKKFIDALQTL
ncbi:hypothetical protein [Mesorhizobium sp. IMUNJ 23232]|uniref:hypothetical protein n=1 Tax=Mesorhizobium sp. IMUNJ 23232 TaxID=3376064 RepID=UPI0037A9548A